MGEKEKEQMKMAVAQSSREHELELVRVAHQEMVIDRDGSLKQLIPFDRIAWHAGKSVWQGRTGLKRYSVGIKLVNAKENHQSVATVTASLLNFRQQPYKNALTSGDPLPSGKQVELVHRSGKWCKGRVYAEGWVHGDYLRIEE